MCCNSFHLDRYDKIHNHCVRRENIALHGEGLMSWWLTVVEMESSSSYAAKRRSLIMFLMSDSTEYCLQCWEVLNQHWEGNNQCFSFLKNINLIQQTGGEPADILWSKMLRFWFGGSLLTDGLADKGVLGVMVYRAHTLIYQLDPRSPEGIAPSHRTATLAIHL